MYRTVGNVAGNCVENRNVQDYVQNRGGAHPLLPLIAAKSQKRQRHSAATAAFNHVSGNSSKSKPQMI